MEKMTDKEKQTLRQLQAKQKRIARAEVAFLEEADARKEELLKRWGIVAEASPVYQEEPEEDDIPYPVLDAWKGAKGGQGSAAPCEGRNDGTSIRTELLLDASQTLEP